MNELAHRIHTRREKKVVSLFFNVLSCLFLFFYFFMPKSTLELAWLESMSAEGPLVDPPSLF
jgi:hypothetical protein